MHSEFFRCFAKHINPILLESRPDVRLETLILFRPGGMLISLARQTVIDFSTDGYIPEFHPLFSVLNSQ